MAQTDTSAQSSAFLPIPEDFVTYLMVTAEIGLLDAVDVNAHY